MPEVFHLQKWIKVVLPFLDFLNSHLVDNVKCIYISTVRIFTQPIYVKWLYQKSLYINNCDYYFSVLSVLIDTESKWITSLKIVSVDISHKSQFPCVCIPRTNRSRVYSHIFHISGFYTFLSPSFASFYYITSSSQCYFLLFI